MADNQIFSYTKRDYEGARKEGLAKIPILSEGRWTDLNATDPGIIILDYVHALVDMINYYQDHQALETFITTAKERANIFRIAKQLSYEIRSAKGAICNVTFTSSLTYDHPIKIPKNTSLSTSDGIKYLTSEDVYLPKDAVSVEVPCSQGIINSKVYTGTGISKYSTDYLAADQVVTLTADNIDIDSITVIDNIGRVWTPVDYIVFADKDERAYQVELNADDTVSVKFGDGVRGIIPQYTDVLTITYVTSSAEKGRVGANTIRVLDDQIYDNGMYVEFSVSNNSASSGGSASPSSSEIRESAPGAIKAQDRAVTLSDFENLAVLVEGVAGAKAYDINTSPNLCLYHEVKVLIMPEDTGGSSNILKDKVYNYLYNKMIPPTNLQVLLPSSVSVDISVKVKKLDNSIASRVEYDVKDAIVKYFDARKTAIGEPFYPADLSAVISNLSEVRYVIEMIPSSVVTISELSVITAGNISVTVQ